MRSKTAAAVTSADTASAAPTPDGHISLETRPGSTTDYSYNEASRLQQIVGNAGLSAEFAYDAFERRVWRNLPQGEGVHHFVFLPDGRLLGEYEGSTGAVVREYVWMDDRLVGSVDAAGTLTYVQTGPLGQPLLAMNGSGLVLWRGELSPFGKLVSSSFGAVPEARFLGQWDEAGSGLYQNWHRTYDASLGRYLEADPLGLAAGQSLYGYAGQDPVNAMDPEGLSAAAAGVAGGGRGRSGGFAGRAGAAGAAASFWRAAYAAYTSPFRTLAAAMARDGFAPATDSPKVCPRPGRQPSLGLDRGQPPFRPPFIPIGPSGPNDDDGDDDRSDCDQQWRDAYQYCATISPTNPKTRQIWGGSLQSCVKGQVAQRCGGNRVEH